MAGDILEIGDECRGQKQIVLRWLKCIDVERAEKGHVVHDTFDDAGVNGGMQGSNGSKKREFKRGRTYRISASA